MATIVESTLLSAGVNFNVPNIIDEAFPGYADNFIDLPTAIDLESYEGPEIYEEPLRTADKEYKLISAADYYRLSYGYDITQTDTYQDALRQGQIEKDLNKIMVSQRLETFNGMAHEGLVNDDGTEADICLVNMTAPSFDLRAGLLQQIGGIPESYIEADYMTANNIHFSILNHEIAHCLFGHTKLEKQRDGSVINIGARGKKSYENEMAADFFAQSIVNEYLEDTNQSEKKHAMSLVTFVLRSFGLAAVYQANAHTYIDDKQIVKAVHDSAIQQVLKGLSDEGALDNPSSEGPLSRLMDRFNIGGPVWEISEKELEESIQLSSELLDIAIHSMDEGVGYKLQNTLSGQPMVFHQTVTAPINVAALAYLILESDALDKRGLRGSLTEYRLATLYSVYESISPRYLSETVAAYQEFFNTELFEKNVVDRHVSLSPDTYMDVQETVNRGYDKTTIQRVAAIPEMNEEGAITGYQGCKASEKEKLKEVVLYKDGERDLVKEFMGTAVPINQEEIDNTLLDSLKILVLNAQIRGDVFYPLILASMNREQLVAEVDSYLGTISDCNKNAPKIYL